MANRPIPFKKVAVTGVAGQIGGAVARRLAELGYDLVLLDKKPMGNPPAPFVQTDLRDREAVLAAMRGVDAVCHIGEIPNIFPPHSPQDVFDINTAVCRTMLDVAREVGVRRFIYTSSCQVYGYWGSKEFPKDRLANVWPLDERGDFHPPNKYAESKVFNEHACRDASGAMDVLIFRFPWVTPLPGKADERFHRFWAKIDECIGEGFWTYLGQGDATEAYVRGLDPTGAEPLPEGHQPFHFVADEVWGSMPIREKWAKFLPHWPAIPEHLGSHNPPVSCEKAYRFLGWKPTLRMSAAISASAEQTAGPRVVTNDGHVISNR